MKGNLFYGMFLKAANTPKKKKKNANKAYFAMNKLFSSRLLSRAIKKKLYNFYLRSIEMYACET